MPSPTEILQGRMINTYLVAAGLPAFSDTVYFVDGAMTPAFEWLWDNYGKLSSGEQLVFQVAKEIWTWVPEVKIFELVGSLSLDLVDLTFGLYRAWKSGQESVDAWIVEHGGKLE